jgi:four helix bundle protein
MQHFSKLHVWKRAHALVLAIYRETRTFPIDERFGLTAQLRRAASSVPANIAEGSKRRSDADFARFVNIAEGSLGEAEYHLILARDLGYLDPSELLEEVDEVGRMLNGLRERLSSDALASRR